MQPDDILLPWSFEAEASVISALLMNSDRFDLVGDIVTAEMFHDQRHRAMFTAIAGMVMGALCGERALPGEWLRALSPSVREACVRDASALIELSPAYRIQ